MRSTLLLTISVLISLCTFANNNEDSLARAQARTQKLIDSVNSTMAYQTGTVVLPTGVAKLHIPEGFKYLDSAQSNYVLHELWGNPPQTDVLGMLLPSHSGPMSINSYAFVISYDEMGYVKDDDADKINYDDLLKDMKADEAESNKERTLQGYPAANIMGWASRPFYDKSNKVLHWAKNIHFEGEEVNTLNYQVRILGRKGVLSLNAVASMSELDLVKKDIDKVLQIPSFATGFAYEDFDSKTDDVAAWTIGGLVAGKLLVKAGFFAMAAKFLLGAWKFILLGLVAVGGAIKKIFSRKKSEQMTPEMDISAEG